MTSAGFAVLVGVTGQTSKLKPTHKETQKPLSKPDRLVSFPSITQKLSLLSPHVWEREKETRGLSQARTRTHSPVSSEIRTRGWTDNMTCPLYLQTRPPAAHTHISTLLTAMICWWPIPAITMIGGVRYGNKNRHSVNLTIMTLCFQGSKEEKTKTCRQSRTTSWWYDASNTDVAAKKLQILRLGCFTHVFDPAAQKI